MVNRLEQQELIPQPFGGSRINLHTRGAGNSNLVVFIHGLGGSGYGTWQKFPGLLFDGSSPAQSDVAIYDYASMTRRLREGLTTLDFCVQQLAEGVQELAKEYSSIFLVGHSLGGVLAEEVAKAYLQDSAMRDSPKVTPLAALVLFASPRAGTGWAVPPLRNIITGLRWLRRMSGRNEERDRFFSSYVQSHNTALLESGSFLLPRFACIAGRDIFVRPFSASFSVPTNQRNYLTESHTTAVKPQQARDEQVTWLVQVISDVNDVRRQWKREQEHSASHKRQLFPEPDQIIITEFWGDTKNPQWEHIYNQVRESAGSADLTVHDNRILPKRSVDLLIAVSDADNVLLLESPERQKVIRAYQSRAVNERLSVGISPVGTRGSIAKGRVQDWLNERPYLPSIYVQESANPAALREIMLQWLQLVIGRDPRRNASTSSRIEHLLEDSTSPYESM